MRLRFRYVSYGGGPAVIDQMQHMHELMHHMIARSTPSGGAWQPPTDVYENEGAVVVRTELAGVKEEDIEITLFADHLSITGTRHNRVPDGAAAYYLAGILYGAFRLDVPLVAAVNREEIEASYVDGLLTVVLPKATRQEQPTTVRISQQSAATAEAALPQGANNGH